MQKIQKKKNLKISPKKLVAILAMSLLAIGLLTGCGGGESDVKGDPNAENTINSLATVMGKTDADVVKALGEGKAHKNSDGLLTEREYEMTLFSETVLVRVDYTEEGKAQLGTIMMNSSDLAPYKAQMDSLYGKGEEMTASPGDTGYSWKVKKATATLAQAYGIVAIEVGIPE